MLNLAEYRSRPTGLVDFLPWAALVEQGVILNKDGSFQRTARFRGPDLDSATPAELVGVTARLNNALRRLGSGLAIFVEAVRLAAQHYPRSVFPDPASALVDLERQDAFEEAGAHFESRYFLTFVWLPPAEDASRIEGWLYEGRARTGVDPHELLHGFVDRTNRVLQLVEGFMHSTISCELQQVTNQIQMLSNQATMLVNQARNLANLPMSTLSQLQSSTAQTQSLLGQAQNIAFNVQRVEQAYSTSYGTAAGTGSTATMVANAQTRWQNSVAAFEDSLKVQAGVVGNIPTNSSAMTSLVTASQNSTGALQAAQAGNQLLALQSQQLSDVVAVLSAKSRADALEQARTASAEAQGQQNYQTFRTTTGYVPGAVTMFSGN
jgi:P-type conjugative transfer protein TrbJ